MDPPDDIAPLPQDHPTPSVEVVTRLLHDAAGGDERAAEALLPVVYDQLRRAAQNQMGRERSNHTLSATALVHEAYLRLLGDGDVSWTDRAHFYQATAIAMRRILVEHARARARIKRGGDGQRAARQVPLDGDDPALATDPQRILAFDDALQRLEAEDPTAANVVRLRFFAGLTIDETAAAMGISSSSVDREWSFARARLHRLMQVELDA